jgi:GNAT superfamily N-acetyltransferase
MRVVTAAERPELAEKAWEQTVDTIPEYNHHGDVLNVYWHRLDEERPQFQFFVLDEKDEVLVRGHSVPVRWDGSIDDLPGGIDGAISRAFEQPGGDVLCAMLITVREAFQGRGLSSVALRAMRDLAGGHGFRALIAPVRPSWKERYPLVPIERYCGWTRPDGLLFDPWMRVHERAGATILKPEPRSLRITGTLADWETWTGLQFPESGSYWFPHGLTTVEIDRAADLGSYWEPNVWMRHGI